jgi:hypothetical protein
MRIANLSNVLCLPMCVRLVQQKMKERTTRKRLWIVVDPTPQLAVLVKVASSVVTVNPSIATQTVYVCRRLAVIQSKIPMNPVWIVAGPDVRVVWMAIHAPLMVTVLICSVDTTSRQRVNQQIVVMAFLMVMKRVLMEEGVVGLLVQMVPLAMGTTIALMENVKAMFV